MWKTDFYCEECGYTNLVAISVSTEGFEITCPECNWYWWFSSEGQPPSEKEE